MNKILEESMQKKLTCPSICLVLVMVGGTLASNPHFMSGTDYPVGTNPYSICGGDFDGDLDNDLAVCNYMSASVSVLLNNGDGTFAGAVTYDVGAWPRDLITGEFTGDSYLDLAVVSGSPNGFTIMEGNGDGSFQDTALYVPTGMDLPSNPYSICSGDFNHDSYDDIAIAYYNTDNVGIYMNNGDSSFTFLTKYATGSSAWDVISYDLNADDHDDLLVLDYILGEILVLLNQGVGTGYFAAPVSYPSTVTGSPSQISLGDLVGDASVDVVAAVGGTYGGYEIFTGNGDGTFGTGVFTDSIGYPVSLAITDLDNDTDPDLAMAFIITDSMAVVINEGGGTLSNAVKYDCGTTGNAAVFTYANDFDGDNYDDIAIANYDLNSITVLINNGSGGFTDVDDNGSDALPNGYQLAHNYPNPFNPVTNIEYSLPRRSNVRIDVFNMLGQKVRTLVNREESAGSHSVTWDGTNSAGKAVSTGVYFYRFQAGDHVETKKMLLLK
jgi:hypothetical protein